MGGLLLSKGDYMPYQVGDRVVLRWDGSVKVVEGVYLDQFDEHLVLRDVERGYITTCTPVSVAPLDAEIPGDPAVLSLLDMVVQVLADLDNYTVEETHNFIYAALEAMK